MFGKITVSRFCLFYICIIFVIVAFYLYVCMYVYLICIYLYFYVLLLVFSVICMHQGSESFNSLYVCTVHVAELTIKLTLT